MPARRLPVLQSHAALAGMPCSEGSPEQDRPVGRVCDRGIEGRAGMMRLEAAVRGVHVQK
jgi:hypothetical protein